MTFELKKIDVLSAIKVSFLINAVIGLLVGIFIGSFVALIMSFANQFMPYDQMGGTVTAFPGAIGAFGGILMGLLYAVLISVVNGVIVTGVIALLYNLIASWVGGVRVKFNELPDLSVKPTAVLAGQKPAGDGVADA